MVPRVVKHPDVRRDELLDAAAELFATRGYDRTTIDEVVRAARLSKGAFYYYYPSKDAVLEALADRVARAALAKVDDVLEAPALPAVERLNAFLARGRQRTDLGRNTRVFEAIFRDENLALYHRLHSAVAGVMLDPLEQIIRQGVEQGVFRVEDSRTAARIVLLLGSSTREAVARLLAADEERRPSAIRSLELELRQQGIAMDRILGLPDGTLVLTEPGFVDALTEG